MINLLFLVVSELLFRIILSLYEFFYIDVVEGNVFYEFLFLMMV